MNNLNDVWGNISPPPGSGGFTNPQASLGRVINTGISLFIIVASFFMLFYMLWGAFDWIISSGDKERVSKAQSKITNAIVGLIVIVIVLAIFGVITGNILGILKYTNGVWEFNLPTFQ